MKTLRETMEETERQYLLDALVEARGNVTRSAFAAGICRQQFYKKMARHSISCARAVNGGNGAYQALQT